MHPHPAFRQIAIEDRQREIAKSIRFAHVEARRRPPRRSLAEWLLRRCPDVQPPRVREAKSPAAG